MRDVDLEIPEGGIVSIIGPNGAGKTTFFNIVAGIIDPTAGVVEFRGRELIARPRRTWLEAFMWVLPAIVVALIALALGVQNMDELGHPRCRRDRRRLPHHDAAAGHRPSGVVPALHRTHRHLAQRAAE